MLTFMFIFCTVYVKTESFDEKEVCLFLFI